MAVDCVAIMFQL